MPSSVTKKTASARKKRRYSWLGIAGFALALFLAGVTVAALLQNPLQRVPAVINGRTYFLTLQAYNETAGRGVPADKAYHLEVAASGVSQAKGLSGLQDLPRSEGMLFAYKKSDTLCFWMKGMNFPLDIIWLDGAKKIVHIEENIQPSSYPENYCADGQYVVELNAGEARAGGLRQGQAVAF